MPKAMKRHKILIEVITFVSKFHSQNKKKSMALIFWAELGSKTI